LDRNPWSLSGLGFLSLGILSSAKKIRWLAALVTGFLSLGIISLWVGQLRFSDYGVSLLLLFLSFMATPVAGTIALFRKHQSEVLLGEGAARPGIMERIKKLVPRDTPGTKRYALGVYFCAAGAAILAIFGIFQEYGLSADPAIIREEVLGFLFVVIVIALLVILKSRTLALFLLGIGISSVVFELRNSAEIEAVNAWTLGLWILASLAGAIAAFLYHHHRCRETGEKAPPLWRPFLLAGILTGLLFLSGQQQEREAGFDIRLKKNAKNVQIEILNPLYSRAPDERDNITLAEGATVEEILKKTNYHYARREHEQAIALGEAALKRTQDKELLMRIHFSLSSNYLEQGILALQKSGDTSLFKRSIMHANKSLEGFPGHWQALGNIGAAYFNLGDFKNASVYYHRAEKIVNKNNPIYGSILTHALLADELAKNQKTAAGSGRMTSSNSDLVLQGIMEGTPPMAVINDEVVKEGDTLEGYVVKQITKEQVILGVSGRDDVILSFE